MGHGESYLRWVDPKGLRSPPSCTLTQAVRAVDREAHEDDISVRVGERPEAIVVFLPRCVPQGQLHLTYRAGEWRA